MLIISILIPLIVDKQMCIMSVTNVVIGWASDSERAASFTFAQPIRRFAHEKQAVASFSSNSGRVAGTDSAERQKSVFCFLTQCLTDSRNGPVISVSVNKWEHSVPISEEKSTSVSSPEEGFHHSSSVQPTALAQHKDRKQLAWPCKANSLLWLTD